MNSAIYEEARQQEKLRHKDILKHHNVLNGAAIDLAVFIMTQTDLTPTEAHKMLDRAIPAQPDKMNLRS